MSDQDDKTKLLKEKQRIYKRNWQEKNREHYLALQNEYTKKYNHENAEIINAKKKLYYEINREVIKQKQRERYAAKKAALAASKTVVVTDTG